MRSISYLAAIAALALSVSMPVFAKNGDLDPASAKALHDYTLSMDKVKAMQAAMDEAKANAAVQKNMKDVSDSKTIADEEAKLNAMPQAMAVFRKHGLSAHDVVVMPMVLMDAGMAVAYPSAAAKLADHMSQAQVDFYKQHQAELKKMPWLFGG